MADEELRFNIVGDDNLSGPLAKGGAAAEGLSRHMDAAARSAAVLDEALKRQATAARTSVDATLTLAKADKILEEAEHGLRDGALEAEFALKKEADAAKQSGRAADEAAAKNKALRESLKGLSINPGLAAPVLALAPAIGTLAGVTAAAGIGLAGAFTAGAGALAAFGAVAKPVLSSALTASQAVNAAQNNYQATIAAGVPKIQAMASLQLANTHAQQTYNAALASGANPAKALAAEHLAMAKNQATYNSATNAGTFNAKAYAAEQLAIGKAYAELSPQQIALSKQLGAMADAWQKLKAAQTPVVAGALQPWLQSVTSLTKQLGPIIAATSPVIAGLGMQFSDLINSPEFAKFRDFIANTGSQAVLAGGGTLIDFIDSFITLLPQFNPLIEKAVGWIAGLGPAALTWSRSQKAADDITKFMAWFNTNGPVVGGLLKNIGGALKALAPGLSAGGAAELKVMSDFFGWIAKLPKGLAAPLSETAGVLLVLNKLGVIKVGIKFAGAAAGWITKLLGGATVDIGAAGMQKAGDTMVAAAAAMQKAATTMAGAGAAEVTAGTEQGAAGAAEVTAGGLFAGASPAMALLGAALIGAVAYEAAKSANNILNYFKPGGGAAPALTPGGTPPGAFTTTVPKGVVSAAAAQNAAYAASPQGQGVSNLLAQGKAAQAYAVALQDVNEIFAAQVKTAGAARSALDTYTTSVKDSGWASKASKDDAALLVTWLEGVGVKSGTAQTDVVAYTRAIQQNGVTSSQAGMARRQVITDILNASANARQGQTDLGAYTTAVRDNGVKSQNAQSARAKLIQDLVNSGVSAQGAAGLVDGLSTSLGKLPKNTTVTVTETGTGNFTITQGTSGHAGGTPTGGRPGAAAGLYVAAGTGPTADDVLIRASKGELVVPTHLVASGLVDHLRGLIPGFAGGGSIGSLAGQTAGFHDRFTAAMTAAMEKAMTAAMTKAVTAAMSAAAGGTAGAGVQQWKGTVLQALKLLGLPASLLNDVLYQMQTESGGNPTIVNKTDSNWLAGHPSVGLMQVIAGTFAQYAGPYRNTGPFEYGVSTNPLANIYAALNYGEHGAGFGSGAGQIGSGHGYARGGLIPGYASGGSVASQGAAYLKGWHRSAGTVNAQIDHWTHAGHIDSILAGAAGLSKALHAKYAKAAAGDKKTLAGLTSERTTLRDWRTQLSGSDVSLTAWIGAAGKTPALKANVAGWKKQLAAQKATIGDISAMLGLTPAQAAADAAAAKAASTAAVAAAAAASAASAASSAAGAAGTTAPAAAAAAAAVPLTSHAALALLSPGGSGGVSAIPGAAGPGPGAGAFPWSGPGGGQAFPWSGWGGDQGRPGTAAPGGGAGSSSGAPDALVAELRALRAELRAQMGQLTSVAAAIPARTGQHVAGAVGAAGAGAAFRARYPSNR